MGNYPPGMKESDLPQVMSDEEVEEEEQKEGWHSITMRMADGGHTVKVRLFCNGCGNVLYFGDSYTITSGKSRYIDLKLHGDHCDCCLEEGRVENDRPGLG